jgi:hypothetical protein
LGSSARYVCVKKVDYKKRRRTLVWSNLDWSRWNITRFRPVSSRGRAADTMHGLSLDGLITQTISIRPPGYLFALPQLRKYPGSLGRKAVFSRAVGNLDVRTTSYWMSHGRRSCCLGRWLGKIQGSSRSRFLRQVSSEIHSICSHTVSGSQDTGRKTKRHSCGVEVPRLASFYKHILRSVLSLALCSRHAY